VRHLRGGTTTRGLTRQALLPYLVFACGLTAVFIYQATWHLAGFRHPRFVDFMRKYSRRAGTPAVSMFRGRILDRTGLELAGIDPDDPQQRRYPHAASTCHVVGYADLTFGKTGVEKAEDACLQGTTVTDWSGARQFGRNLFRHEGIQGNDVVLTIDAALQQAAHRAFAGQPGAAVGMDPRTGAVRLLYSSPTFNPEDPGGALEAAGSPLFNRALQGLYPPGSSFKILVAAAAVKQGRTGRLDCPGAGFAAVAGVKPIRDHEYYRALEKGRTWKGHGFIDIGEAFRLSSNVYFAKRAISLGPTPIVSLAEAAGFTGLWTLLRGSSSTLLSKACNFPLRETSGRAELAQVAIGQGRLLVTPLHMACLAATVASGGSLYRPFLLAGTPPEKAAVPLARAEAGQVGEFMRRVVLAGTASRAAGAGLGIAGKTGTAQNPLGEDHGWFVCFAPHDRPALALAVIAENSGYGSGRALDIALAVMREAAQAGLLTAGGRHE